MIVADTSVLLSLAAGNVLSLVLDEFDVHTTQAVITEVENTAEYDDEHGTAARSVLDTRDRLIVHSVPESMTTSRIDDGEGSCAVLANQAGADFLLTDDLRALPELQTATDAQVAISPIVLKALVKRETLTTAEAVERLERIGAGRDWLGAPIYRRATDLFEH